MDRENALNEARAKNAETEQRKAWEGEQRRAAGTTSEPLLGKFTQDDVIRAAGAIEDNSSMWLASAWDARKDAIVALAFHPTEFGYEVKQLDPRLFVLQETSGKLAPVAQTKLDLSHANCSNDSGEPAGGWSDAPKFALDLGACEVTPGQTAVGVRLTCMYTFPAGQGIETRLYLAELKDGTLRQIFEAMMAREDFQRPAATWGTTHGVLAVQPTQHAGYFDLELRSEFNLRYENPEAGKPSQRTRTERFVWIDNHYSPAHVR